MINKSDLLKQLSNSFPNFLKKKDLSRAIEIVLNEIKISLKRGDRVELRSSLGVFYTNIQKASIRRNPRTSEKIAVKAKRTINFKMSKELFKRLNDEE